MKWIMIIINFWVKNEKFTGKKVAIIAWKKGCIFFRWNRILTDLPLYPKKFAWGGHHHKSGSHSREMHSPAPPCWGDSPPKPPFMRGQAPSYSPFGAFGTKYIIVIFGAFGTKWYTVYIYMYTFFHKKVYSIYTLYIIIWKYTSIQYTKYIFS